MSAEPIRYLVCRCRGQLAQKERMIHTAGALQSAEHIYRRHSGADGGATSGIPGRTTGTAVQDTAPCALCWSFLTLRHAEGHHRGDGQRCCASLCGGMADESVCVPTTQHRLGSSHVGGTALTNPPRFPPGCYHTNPNRQLFRVGCF